MKFLKKILLVDHEPQVTALVRHALESTGRYLVKVEQDSRLALHAAPWFLPDLILLDAAKAQSEGEAVNRQLKAEPALKDTPFLFLPTLDMRGFSRDRYRDARTVSFTSAAPAGCSCWTKSRRFVTGRTS